MSKETFISAVLKSYSPKGASIYLGAGHYHRSEDHSQVEYVALWSSGNLLSE